MEQGCSQEYLTGNESIAFPFKENAEGLIQKDETPVHGASATLPRNFLLDMVMTVPAQHQAQVFLKSISRAGSTYTFIFSSTLATSLFSGSMTTIPVERSIVALQDISAGITVRMVTGSAFNTYLAAIGDMTIDSFQERLPLETAAVEFVPFKLLELLLAGQGLSGDIILYEGYNVQLDSTPSDPVTGAPAIIRITAGSGLGTGRYDSCGDITDLGYIGRINGQTADSSGNLQLDTDSCYRLLPDAPASRIQIANDCIPCCTCGDYANQVAALKLLYVNLVSAKNALDAAALKVNQDITEWNNVIVPALFKLTADIYVARGNQTGVFTDPDRKVSSGKSPNFASIIAVVRNPGSEPVTGVSVVISGLGTLTILQSVYFDSAGQHLAGIDTSFTGVTLNSGTYFKAVLLVRDAYPTAVSGVYTVTVSAAGMDPVTKSVTV